MLRKQFPGAVPVMDAAKEDVLAYSYGEDFVWLHFTDQHWRKIWSTNPLERLNAAPTWWASFPTTPR